MVLSDLGVLIVVFLVLVRLKRLDPSFSHVAGDLHDAISECVRNTALDAVVCESFLFDSSSGRVLDRGGPPIIVVGSIPGQSYDILFDHDRQALGLKPPTP